MRTLQPSKYVYLHNHEIFREIFPNIDSNIHWYHVKLKNKIIRYNKNNIKIDREIERINK